MGSLFKRFNYGRIHCLDAFDHAAIVLCALIVLLMDGEPLLPLRLYLLSIILRAMSHGISSCLSIARACNIPKRILALILSSPSMSTVIRRDPPQRMSSGRLIVTRDEPVTRLSVE